MAVPYRLLMDGEDVVVHRHPHVRVLFRPAVVTVVTVAIAGLLIAVVSQASTRWGIAAAALVLVTASAFRPVLHWATTTLTVTDRRLLLRSGVLSRYGRDIPLGRIDEVSFEHTLLERALGCGTLYVELAGERGVVVVQNVPRVERVQAAIYELLDDEFEELDEDLLEELGEPQ
ncbi:PH domain-containing protein [Cryptosporangium aurantiacum]|uniref:PH domain-containing protein n=1 Tax=Cryptosporangium aurantiacum TaxID=134849 RepID=A0A1M7QVL4_9ACTN|nr:PH domain-containing protein [Cryptosporangium aurantiacum]SHN35648.1 PH domain-containing protein [Cryptosporangium aurantiacum]